MTVRVRQLVRVTSGRIPPTPPVVITMRFVQQPTDTAVNELFTPTVSVEISDGGNDVLRISSECVITPITVTAENGLAVFTGLRTGNQPATDCHLRVENLSRPGIAPIVSDPFDIVAVVSVPLEIVNGGNAFGLAVSADTVSVSVTVQSNGDPFDTTGADLIIVAIASDNEPSAGLNVIVDGNAVAYNFQQIHPSAQFPGIDYFFTRPQVTGITVFNFSMLDSFASMTAIALRGWNGQTPTIFGGLNIISTPQPVVALRLPQPLPTVPSNGFVMANAGTWRGSVVAFAPGYTGRSVPFNLGGYAPGMQWKFTTDVNEDPVFTVNTVPGFELQAFMAAIVFEPV